MGNSEVFYIERYKPYSTLRDAYATTDSVELVHYVFCATTGKFGKEKEWSRIETDDSYILSSLNSALNRTELPIRINKKHFRISPKTICATTSHRTYPKSVQNMLESEEYDFIYPKNNKTRLFVLAEYTAIWDWERVIEAPAGVLSTDRRHYRINRSVTAIILEQDTVAYYQCFMHRDTAYTNREEGLKFNFPQEIFDSLTVLSLQKYKERLR